MSTPTPSRNAPLWVTVVLIVVAVAMAVVAVVYFSESAAKLPSFFPGHQAGSSHHHSKHGIAAAIVAVLALAGAWLSSGHKTAA